MPQCESRAKLSACNIARLPSVAVALACLILFFSGHSGQASQRSHPIAPHALRLCIEATKAATPDAFKPLDTLKGVRAATRGGHRYAHLPQHEPHITDEAQAAAGRPAPVFSTASPALCRNPAAPRAPPA